jgi:hypothetical protein
VDAYDVLIWLTNAFLETREEPVIVEKKDVLANRLLTYMLDACMVDPFAVEKKKLVVFTCAESTCVAFAKATLIVLPVMLVNDMLFALILPSTVAVKVLMVLPVAVEKKRSFTTKELETNKSFVILTSGVLKSIRTASLSAIVVSNAMLLSIPSI